MRGLYEAWQAIQEVDLKAVFEARMLQLVIRNVIKCKKAVLWD